MSTSDQVFAFLNWGLPLAILILAYFIGSYIERRHLRKIQEREQALPGFPVTTFEALPPNWEVERTTMVSGSVVISLDYFKRVIAGLRAIVGGRVKCSS